VKKMFQVVTVLLMLVFLVSIYSASVVVGSKEDRELKINNEAELKNWWNPGFDGYSTEQIKAAIGFEDTTDKINPRPSSIVWEEEDTFAANVVWTGPLDKIHTEKNKDTYRFRGRSPLAFDFLSLIWRSHDLVTGMPTEVAPESFEVWYRSSPDGISFGEWFQTKAKGDFKCEDSHYIAPHFGLSTLHGQTHKYFEILVHVPPYTRLDEVNLEVSDNTTNTLIKHGLMTDAAIKSAIEKGMVSIKALEPAVKSELLQRGVIMKDNSVMHDNRVETEPFGTDWDIMGVNNIYNPTSSPPRPTIISRAQWWGDLPAGDLNSPRWAPVYGNISHAIIHHTVHPNNPEDPMSVVRSIWRDHEQRRLGDNTTWGDIGYNFLIDHHGNIYHGRHNPRLDASPPQDVWGRHASNFNSGSMGVGFIGTFTAENPTTAAINNTNRLIAWRFHQRNIDPLSVGWIGAAGGTGLLTPRNITRIFGHMDVAATNCPGYFFYDRLPRLIRLTVASLMGRMRSPILFAPMGGEGWRRAGYPAYQSGIVWWHFPEVPATSGVRIELSEDSGRTWRTIVTSTANDGNERWPVPGAGHSTSTARIRVISLQNPTIRSESISDFYLANVPW